MNSYPRWRRRQWLVDKRQQLPFASSLLLQSTLLVAALGVFAYLYNHRMMALALELVNRQQERLSQQLYDASQLLLLGFVVAIAVTVIVQLLFGIYSSHKLAGPVLKMTRILRELEAGRTPPRVVFRKGDYLDELADALNALISGLEERSSVLERELPVISGAVEGLRVAVQERRQPAEIPELRRLKDSLQQLAQNWPVGQQPADGQLP
jgi:hypothetical protein